ncbi:SUMF1/EgtB/PvdO family nonheme iron enzyme [Luteolibacter algae]|uniref:SUMF1/EgtB/PvdO family nonheme iron enzyme n=1 Tax=Luteolibacter algae TaxID=454151 RepID=A0ABW5D9B7_9BACT
MKYSSHRPGMPDVTNEHTYGDYIPRECISETEKTRTWLAEQESVGRMVLIEELKEEAMEDCDSFLADVRAKAAVEHPLVGSIYEASRENGRCFFAQELLPGETLEQRLKAGEKIQPVRFVHILRRVAEANIYHETHDNATSPMGLEDVHVDSHDVIRIKNLAICGSSLPGQSSRDVTRFGTSYQALLDTEKPGATRCLTLLAWMRGEQIEAPLQWAQVRGYCEQIEQQLTDPTEMPAPATSALLPGKKSGFVGVIAIILGILALCIFLIPGKKKPTRASEVKKPDLIMIPAGRHITPDGMRLRTDSFRISAYEVTIGEYAEFLERLSLLSESGKETTFDHPEQPEKKTDHIPDNWDSLLAAATESAEWGGHEISIHTPVVGVDWWDAYAYAKWKRGFLPTQEQWFSALMTGAKVPSAIPISDWLPVDEQIQDRTSNGLLAMAGSVAEWTSEPRPTPSNPLGTPLWVLAGGSYLKPSKGAASREWVEDRSLRRADLGFRICMDIE